MATADQQVEILREIIQILPVVDPQKMRVLQHRILQIKVVVRAEVQAIASF